MILQSGTQFGPFLIVDRIGTGGMGVVYRAHDTRLRRDVALKLLGTDRPAGLDDVLREARTIAVLNHPHICTVHEVGIADGVPFIAMELIDGESLRTLIQSGRWSADRVWRIGRQLADALEHAHAHGVIHRDFKTANVLITRDGRAKVVDFGISVRTPVPTQDTATAAVPEPGTVISGTVPYMAPETLLGDWPDARSDIWALGVVLYEMTSGRPPFGGRTTHEVVAAIQRDPVPPLPAGTAPGLVRVIERCLSKDPAERPAHAGEVALALEVAAPTSVTVEKLTPPSKRHTGRGPTLLATAATVGVLGVSYGLWSMSPGESGPVRFDTPQQVTTAVGVEEFPAWSPDGTMLAYVGRVRGAIDNSAESNSDVWIAQPGRGTAINRTDDHDGRDLFPAWSPNGSQVAFWSDRDGAGCYVMAALSGAPRRIAAANAINPSPPQWSEDGRDILCVSGDRQTSLDVVSVATGQVRHRITLPGDLPRLVTRTRNERLIAFITGPGGLTADLTRLSVLDVESSEVAPITDGQTLVSSPNWSADGRTLYYVARAGATMDLWEQRIAPNGAPVGAPTALTAGIGMRNATLSRDGRRLAYSQGRRVANVWRVPFQLDRPATWADAEQLTFDQSYIECVSLDRAGTTLALNSDRAGSIDLWLLPASGGEMTQLTSDPSAEWCPDWSPDGTTLAFYAHRTGNREIWTVPAKGGAWRQITDHPGPDLHPSWSYDGQSIGHLTGGRDGRVGFWASRVDGTPGSMLFTLPGTGALRWAPTDARMTYVTDGRVWVIDTAAPTATPARPLTSAIAGGPRWTPDGRSILYRAQPSAIHIIDASGTSQSRLLVDLSGRPGDMGLYGTPTDGRFVYFTWNDDLGDIWVMDAASSAR